MRRTTPKQRRLFTPLAEDTLPAELSEIDELIRLRSEWAKWILKDLTDGATALRGREGMPPEQVLPLQCL